MARKFWLAVAFLCMSWAPAAAQEGVLSELYGKGVHAYFANRPWVALEYFNSALDNGSNDPRAHYFRGLTYLQLGDQGSADSDFRQGAEIETTDSNEFYDVSRALERIQGRQRLTIESYRTNGRLEALKRAKQLEYERYERIRTSEPNVTIPPEEAPPVEALPVEPATEPAAAPVQDPFAEEPATEEPAADPSEGPAMEEETLPEPAAEEPPVEAPADEPTPTEEPPTVEEPAADPAAIEPDAAEPAVTEPDAAEPAAADATEELAPDEAMPAEEPAADAEEPATDAAEPAAEEAPAEEPAAETTEEPAEEAAPAKASAAVRQPAQRRALEIPFAKKASPPRAKFSRPESAPVKSARADRLARDLAWLRGIKSGGRK